jgi:hypothetical protein
MSSYLRACLMTAIAVAFGMALVVFIFGIVTVAILGAVTGPGAVIAVGAALPILLAQAFIFGAAVFIAQVVSCILADNQRSADVQAGAPGGGGQPLEEDKKEPRCQICEIMHQLSLAGAVAGMLIGVILSRT